MRSGRSGGGPIPSPIPSEAEEVLHSNNNENVEIETPFDCEENVSGMEGQAPPVQSETSQQHGLSRSSSCSSLIAESPDDIPTPSVSSISTRRRTRVRGCFIAPLPANPSATLQSTPSTSNATQERREQQSQLPRPARQGRLSRPERLRVGESWQSSVELQDTYARNRHTTRMQHERQLAEARIRQEEELHRLELEARTLVVQKLKEELDHNRTLHQIEERAFRRFYNIHD